MKRIIQLFVLAIFFLTGTDIQAQKACCSANAGIDSVLYCIDSLKLEGRGNCDCIDTLIVDGDTTILHCTSNLYSWSPITSLSNPNISNPVASPTITTTYTLTTYCYDPIHRDTCCISKDSVIIIVRDTCTFCCSADAGKDTTICCVDGFTLYGTGTCHCTDSLITDTDTTIIHCSTLLYSWQPTGSLSNPNIANPFASPTVTTTYTLTTYCYDPITKDTCCTATDSVVVTVFDNCCRKARQINYSSLGISIYPNPTKGNVSLEFKDEITEGKIFIYDNAGRIVFYQIILNTKGSINLAVSDLAKGSYLIQVDRGNEIIYSNNLIIE